METFNDLFLTILQFIWNGVMIIVFGGLLIIILTSIFKLFKPIVVEVWRFVHNESFEKFLEKKAKKQKLKSPQ